MNKIKLAVLRGLLAVGVLASVFMPMMEVWAAPIIMGSAAIDRGSFGDANRTVVDLNNPATGTGFITEISVYAHENITGLRAGTFYLTGGTTYKCRDSAILGNTVGAGVQTFPLLNIYVVSGDVVGFYSTAGTIDRDGAGGSGQLFVGGEFIDAGDETAFFDDPGIINSVYFTGMTIEAPTLTTSAATSITTTTATLNGEITVTGGENADIRGFVYDTATHGDPGNVAPAASAYSANWTENGSFGAATFSTSVTGLSPGTTYYFRSVGHNSAGYAYSAEGTFASRPEDAGKIILRGTLRLLLACAVVVGVVLKSGNKGTGLMVTSLIGVIAFALVDALIALI